MATQVQYPGLAYRQFGSTPKMGGPVYLGQLSHVKVLQASGLQQDVNVNVNVSVYSLKSPLSSADLQFTPLVLELFLIQSHLLWGEFSICAHCCSYSQSLQFSFLVPPGTYHCWVDRGGVIWEACPTPLHMTGHVLPLCESCSRTTLPCLQYPTSSVVYVF